MIISVLILVKFIVKYAKKLIKVWWTKYDQFLRLSKYGLLYKYIKYDQLCKSNKYSQQRR